MADATNAAPEALTQPLIKTTDSGDFGEANSAPGGSMGGKYWLADSGRGAADSRRAPAQSRSIYIDASTVLCIAQKGIQPTGKPVAQKGKRPAGIAVYGLSGLGIGVLDGDVLTDVLGQHVRLEAQVVAMVIAARTANMSTISGTLWRGMRAYAITVEQPYSVPNCSIEERDCWRSRCVEDKPQHGSSARVVSSVPTKKTKQAIKH